MSNRIICKQCGQISFNDYYGYCSMNCFMDFADKSGLTLNSVKFPSGEEAKIQKLEWEIEDLDSSLSYYTSLSCSQDCLYADKARVAEEKVNDIKREMEVLKERQAEDMNRIRQENALLIEENRKLKNKYNRFEIMEIW